MASKVVVYTTSYCPFCHAAKRLLESKGVKFEEIDVTDDSAARAELERKSGMETVPQVFADGRLIGGYDDLARLFASGKSL